MTITSIADILCVTWPLTRLQETNTLFYRNIRSHIQAHRNIDIKQQISVNKFTLTNSQDLLRAQTQLCHETQQYKANSSLLRHDTPAGGTFNIHMLLLFICQNCNHTGIISIRAASFHSLVPAGVKDPYSRTHSIYPRNW